MTPQIKVLSKTVKSKQQQQHDLSQSDNETDRQHAQSNPSPDQNQISEVDLLFKNIKLGQEANTFKLIDDKTWNIISSIPASETTYFDNGHSAMSIISVIGSKGVGKSSLLNKLARKDAFKTCSDNETKSASINLNHVTRGIDIHSTHLRIFLDCQPLLASSVLEDFLAGRSSSQFSDNLQLSDPLVSSHMISIQLATFLMAACDYVIIMIDWHIDVHLLKLISTAIMLIGEDNLRTKLIMFSQDERVHSSEKFKILVDNLLGKNRVVKYFSDVQELYTYIAPYSDEKCNLYHKDPATFTGRNWLNSCQRLWKSTIKGSSMFVDYALQVYNSYHH